MDKWPNALVDFVRWIKRDFSPVKEPTFLGVHLDLPFRFGLMAVLYALISKKTTRKWAFGICLLVLIGKEVFDTFAVQTISRAHWPTANDLSALPKLHIIPLAPRTEGIGPQSDRALFDRNLDFQPKAIARGWELQFELS